MADEVQLSTRVAELEAKLKELADAKAAEAVTAVEAPVKGPCVAFRAWLAAKEAAVKSFSFVGAFNRFLTGARTFLFFGVSGALGLADSFNGIDLSGLADKYLGIQQLKVGDIVTILAVGGIVLRAVTKTPAFTRWQKAATSSGNVDEPEEAPAA